MTRSRLPEITLTCGNGHPFTTRAAGGTAVRCKTCRKSKHVPVDRPKTDREATARVKARAREDQDQGPAGTTEPDPGAELAARWETEPEWAGSLVLAPGRAGDECPECGGPLSWEPGRTLTYCEPCDRAGLPAAVSAHYEHQARRSTEVAARTVPDRAAERTARARLRALKEQAQEYAGAWLDTLGDPDCYDQAQWQAQASQFGALIRGYLPEITGAADETDLAEIRQEISALVASPEGVALRRAYDESLGRAESRARAVEYAQQQAEAEAEAEREQLEAEREAERQTIARERERPAITTGPGPARPRPTGGLESSVALLAVRMQQSQDRKARDIAECGACQFQHWGQAVAGRLFGVPFRDALGRMNGRALEGAPQYRACAKHYTEAEKRLNREGYADVCYWDLPLQQTGSAGHGWG